MLDVFGVDVGESIEFGLVHVHDEEFVRRCQLGYFTCELWIKI